MIAVGLSLVLNVVVLTLGLVWAKRQMRRVEAERATERREGFLLDPPPVAGCRVLALVEDDQGGPAEVIAIYLPHVGWIDGVTLMRIEDEVLGWRPLPGTREELIEPMTWNDVEVEAEVRRRYPS